MELNELRERIDRVDRQLIQLLEQRMDVAADIAAWKQAAGAPVLDAAREEVKLAAVADPEEKRHIGAEEGFINHRGEFLTRDEAYNHAIECGQIPAELRHLKAQRNETALFSEDLY